MNLEIEISFQRKNKLSILAPKFFRLSNYYKKPSNTKYYAYFFLYKRHKNCPNRATFFSQLSLFLALFYRWYHLYQSYKALDMIKLLNICDNVKRVENSHISSLSQIIPKLIFKPCNTPLNIIKNIKKNLTKLHDD